MNTLASSIRRVLFTISLLPLFALIANAQEAPTTDSLHIPQPRLWNVNLGICNSGIVTGIEYTLGPKTSLNTEFLVQFLKNTRNSADGTTEKYYTGGVSITPRIKYYPTGEVGQGFFVRGSLTGAYLFPKTHNRPYYLGIGAGLGYDSKFSKNSRWGYFFSAGIRYPIFFGPKSESKKSNSIEGAVFDIITESFNVMYLVFVSPFSFFEASYGISFSF